MDKEYIDNWERQTLAEKFDYAVTFWNNNNRVGTPDILSFYYVRAMQENDYIVLEKLMNYCKIPDTMTLKERLAYYELIGDGKAEE